MTNYLTDSWEQSSADVLPVLENIRISAVIENMFVEASVEHDYRNTSAVTIEAVYSFTGGTRRGVFEP
ncbi:MAG: hypothetical protein HOE62_04055 [Alphaproteobacteria bacterium]|jgi:hypothetical protein|nr:hypothetical protein [Alphaproteobacteria bacterium]MBT4017097.1 hypothetical protein [Alphaproteobacteria bacterium]MBT4546053.1 hypothetical protein [Alphaproteobacteria bacterium]MBT7745077.1 hypothetical protein [Alphaproteobacteria bacterium]